MLRIREKDPFEPRSKLLGSQRFLVPEEDMDKRASPLAFVEKYVSLS